MSAPVVAISVGCPSGVGPEVAVAAAAAATSARAVLVGDVVRRAARLRRVALGRLVAIDGRHALASLEPGQVGVWVASTPVGSIPEPGAPSPDGGAAQLAWIDEATDLVEAGVARALVTGPVSKHAIATSGLAEARSFRGHTEHLAERLGAREVVMAFRSDKLTTALVTTHLPLAKVPEAITPAAVSTATYWLARLVKRLGKRRPRIVFAALNPHAGEGGLLGKEETRRIAPGMARAQQRLEKDGVSATLVGPMGAETAFRRAAAGDFDAVVAMYHDQATIPCKLTGFGESVNVTLGLPIIRTSVDHGTGYDVAGTGKADPRGMREAIDLAVRLAARRG
jgi:4-hydroxythreonine-4-phosphate dehydrogenase